MFLTSENTYNYSKLKEVTKKLTYDLNKIIEKNNDVLNEVLYTTYFYFMITEQHIYESNKFYFRKNN